MTALAGRQLTIRAPSNSADAAVWRDRSHSETTRTPHETNAFDCAPESAHRAPHRILPAMLQRPATIRSVVCEARPLSPPLLRCKSRRNEWRLLHLSLLPPGKNTGPFPGGLGQYDRH